MVAQHLFTEKRFKDAVACRSAWGKYRAASLSRRQKWAQVQNQADGAPPFSNAEFLRTGQGWRCNINFRDASSALEQVLVQYWRLLHDTPNLISAMVHGDDPNAERWSQMFQLNFNRFVDDWSADYVRNYLLATQNLIMFGIGAMSYFDRYTPRWEVVRVGDIEVPKKAKASLEKISQLMVLQEVELEELWRLIRTPEKKEAARTAGWNVEAIERLVARATKEDSGSEVTPGDVLEMQREFRNNSAGVCAGREPIRAIHAFVREFDDKISRYIFEEHGDDEDFLFDDSSSEFRPEKMTEALSLVFFDAGNGDFWGAKGFGVKNYGLASVTNRLKSRAVDRTLLDGLNFRDMSSGVRETVPIVNVGPFNFLPKDVEQLNVYPTGRSILETIQLIDQQTSYNNARYRDAGKQIADTDTATQANILAGIQGQVDVANATLFLKQWASNIFTEQFRRLRMKDSPDPDAKAFFKRCVTDGGMPEEVFYGTEVSLRTGADPGAANMVVQGQKALELLSLPAANRRWAQERYVSATFGAQAVSKALLPEDATAEIRSQRLALIENSEMGQGNPMPVDPQDNHAAHIPVHLQPLSVIVDAYKQSGRINPDSIVAIQLTIPHLDAHFEELAKDKIQQPLYRQLWPAYTDLRSHAAGIMRQIERMHAQAQQGRAPGFSPAATVGANAPQ